MTQYKTATAADFTANRRLRECRAAARSAASAAPADAEPADASL